MKWGVRRYQNKDGSLTPEGRIHYGQGSPSKTIKKVEKIWNKQYNEIDKIRNEQYDYMEKESKKRTNKTYDELYNEAAKQNPDLDSGKLKYENSLWKQINDIEDEAHDIYQKKHDEIYQKHQKELCKVGEDFIEDYFKTHKLDKITTSELFDMMGDKNYSSVNILIDSVISGNNYSFDYEDYSIRKK